MRAGGQIEQADGDSSSSELNNIPVNFFDFVVTLVDIKNLTVFCYTKLTTSGFLTGERDA